MTKSQTVQYNKVEQLAHELYAKAEALRDALQEDMDSKSEDWQESDAAAETQDAIDRLDGFIGYLDDANSEL